MDIPNGDNSKRVHWLRGDRLEELALIQFKLPDKLLWLADRLLVADYDIENESHAAIELEVSDTRLELRSQLIATSENSYVYVSRLCTVDDRLAIVNDNSKAILHYSFASKLELKRPVRLPLWSVWSQRKQVTLCYSVPYFTCFIMQWFFFVITFILFD